jgi:hypothetical protein
VDETGPWIVAHTASREPQSGIPQGQGINPGDPNIDGVCLHVQAAPSDTRRAGAKKLVAPGSSVAADNLNLGRGMAEGRRQIGQDVENARIVVLYLSRAMIAKEMVELLFRFGKEGIAAPVHDVDVLTCVGMVEPEAMKVGVAGIGAGCAAALD